MTDQESQLILTHRTQRNMVSPIGVCCESESERSGEVKGSKKRSLRSPWLFSLGHQARQKCIVLEWWSSPG